MKKFLLGDFYEGDRVILRDGQDAIVLRLEDSESLRVKTVDGRERVIGLAEVIGREGPPPLP